MWTPYTKSIDAKICCVSDFAEPTEDAPEFNSSRFRNANVGDAPHRHRAGETGSRDSRAQVDDMVRKAVDAGGSTPTQPRDHGFMYHHGYQDLDGHMWEIMFMERAAMPKT